MERKFVIQARGYEFEWLMDRETGLFDLRAKEIEAGGKQRRAVKDRSVLRYWGGGARTWAERGRDIEKIEHRLLAGQ